jgi:hypothetical protein
MGFDPVTDRRAFTTVKDSQRFNQQVIHQLPTVSVLLTAVVPLARRRLCCCQQRLQR